MFECPVCGKRAIGAIRKLWLGPAGFATCVSCGARVTVSERSFVSAIPFIVAFAAWLLYRSPLTVAAVVVTGILFTVIHQWFVPLVRKRKKGER
jgi:predicted RNA-binding Zn-ribbon protein involved in translation (DUF1610 family)